MLKINQKTLLSTSGLVLTAVLFVAVTVLANALLTSWRIDLTESKLFTLSDGTRNILQALEEPVRLDFYFSQKAMLGYPSLTNYGARVRDMLLEYQAHSSGLLELNIIDPEVFSEEEDQAVASGLQGVPLNNAGERGYFGLVGTSSTDDEKVIPFFHAERESALEYDISKLVHNLSHPQKKVVGILSSLPIYGDPLQGQAAPQWAIVDNIKDFFEVRQLSDSAKSFAGIDVLMIVHPKDLADDVLFAIDQYLLSGGKAMIFIDPWAEGEPPDPELANSGVLPDVDSDLQPLTDAWGINILDKKIAGDLKLAMQVQMNTGGGAQQVIYLPWLKLGKENFDANDFVTSQLKIIHMASAGIITRDEDSGVQLAPLIETTRQSMQLDREFLFIQRDPNILLNNFTAENKKQMLAARVKGQVKTAFPDGPDGPDDDEEGEGGDQKADKAKQENSEEVISEGELDVIVVADTDILTDIFWIRKRAFLGLDIPQTIANNADFVVNSLESLAGGSDLASLRTRSEYTRPFEKVESIRREAELEYREQEQRLSKTLQETEQKILAIQKEQNSELGDGGTVLLTSRQGAEIKEYQALRIETRKKLRAVQHNLQKDIESLGSWMRFFNIAFLPLLIIFITIVTSIYRFRYIK